MALKQIYNHLPTQIQPIPERLFRVGQLFQKDPGYFYVNPWSEPSPQQTRDRFISTFFESVEQYQQFVSDFEESPAGEVFSQYSESRDYDRIVREQHTEPDYQHNRPYWLGIKWREGLALYALTRQRNPEVFLETGVANGWSSLCILSGMEDSGVGELYSIDYVTRSEKTKSALEAEQYNFFGNAQIPADREPGWLVPDKLRHRWEIRTGRSQAVLPNLITDLERLDVFQHDSEHSDSCMMMEYELGWEHLRDGGLLLSDDISLGWEIWTDERQPADTGLIAYPNHGYAVK